MELTSSMSRFHRLEQGRTSFVVACWEGRGGSQEDERGE